MQGSSLPTGELTVSEEHVRYAFQALINHFSRHDHYRETPNFENWNCPLFVTWKKASRNGERRLRGCIGILEPRRLHQALHDYALTSALHDRRFPPIEAHELPALECTVSLLHSFETGGSWEDWVPGVHGIIIEFACPLTGGTRSATFLPEIAQQEGWTRVQTIDQLISKAGARGGQASLRSIRAGLSLVRYQSTAASLTHAQFLALQKRRAEVQAPEQEPCMVAVQA
ncbi:hypothetical protein ACKKBG_A07130 [Auxenochlorella protothecoides x Auxenochlorella symbiontica]